MSLFLIVVSGWWTSRGFAVSSAAVWNGRNADAEADHDHVSGDPSEGRGGARGVAADRPRLRALPGRGPGLSEIIRVIDEMGVWGAAAIEHLNLKYVLTSPRYHHSHHS